jgi:rSAM/selenodomain-associated transferase 1
MPQNKKTLLLFTRFPEAGNTKTRLIPALGADGAAALQRRMTEQTLLQAKTYSKQEALNLEIHFQGGDPAAMAQWLGPHTFKRQAPGTIGSRMNQAFAQAFAAGMAPVVLIGADCPGLTATTLQHAFLALQQNDLVLGPALDGGYYLIGLNTHHPLLFDDIAWGTPSVLQQTLTKAQSLTVSQLTALHDIDRPQDLAHFDYHSNP